MYSIQHCFSCRLSGDSLVPEDAGPEPGTVAPIALAVRRSDHLATVDLIHIFMINCLNVVHDQTNLQTTVPFESVQRSESQKRLFSFFKIW
jgi:hypothetical protein